MSSSVNLADSHKSNAIAIWLLVLAGLVFAMVLVGGATRLTDSGLSITEWRPVTGIIPPLGSEAWDTEFEKYRQIPEYAQINQGMSLGEFKTIYFWEWGHRLLGRLIGAVFLFPFLFFLFSKAIEGDHIPRLTFLFILGGAQGALGWFMVMSGLADRVDVSQYRLAAHLGLAMLIYGALFWTALDYLQATWGVRSPPSDRGRFAWGTAALGLLVFIQILLGAFVAGLNAGFIYNTWPLMDGALIPSGLASGFATGPLDDHLTVQFLHRMGAYVVVLAGAGLWLLGRTISLAPRQRKALNMVLAIVALQVALGIWTLVAVVPLWLGLLHQAGAVMTLTAVIYLLHLLWAKPNPAKQ